MLRELLQIINQDGMINALDLAKRLDTTPDLIEQMLLQLERMGRINSLPTCQTDHCSDCPISKTCQGKSPRVWSLRR